MGELEFQLLDLGINGLYISRMLRKQTNHNGPYSQQAIKRTAYASAQVKSGNFQQTSACPFAFPFAFPKDNRCALAGLQDRECSP